MEVDTPLAPSRQTDKFNVPATFSKADVKPVKDFSNTMLDQNLVGSKDGKKRKTSIRDGVTVRDMSPHLEGSAHKQVMK